jgi:8-oxo-dGTP diphosphatase
MPLRVVGAAIFRGDRVLAARRGPGRSLAGWWEFPGGKVEPGESDPTALAREIREELGVELAIFELLGESHGAVHLLVYRCTAEGEIHPTEHDAIRWLAVHELEAVGWAEADVPMLPAVAAALGSRAGKIDE